MCPFETKKELAAGKRRRRYEHLDVVYYMRPRKSNLARVISDYEQAAEAPQPDFLEQCFPCMFRGLALPPDEAPPMYSDCRLLLIPGPPQTGHVSNADLSFEWLSTQIATRGRALARLDACVCVGGVAGRATRVRAGRAMQSRSSCYFRCSVGALPQGPSGSTLPPHRHPATLPIRAWKRDGPTRECVPEVMAYEPNLFSLDMTSTLSTVYTAQLRGEKLEGHELEDARDAVFDHLDMVAYRVATACITMNEMPYIRFSASSRGIAEVVARSLAKSLKAYRDANASFRPYGDARPSDDDADARYGPGARTTRPAGEPPEPAVVLIVDRADDIVPALLHDITYSCLVVDLLDHIPATPFRYTYKEGRGDAAVEKEKNVLLDDADPVWRLHRYEDMGTSIDSSE